MCRLVFAFDNTTKQLIGVKHHDSFLFPTAIGLLPDGGFVFGKPAVEHSLEYADKVYQHLKRLMGLNFDEATLKR